MIKQLLILISLSLIIACNQGSDEKGQAPLRPHEEYYLLKNFPNLEGGAEGFLQAVRMSREMASQRGDLPPGFEETWINQGPDNIGGRVNSLFRHPEQPELILAGLTAGGIYKSTDGGQNWYPVFDDQSTLSISFIEGSPVDPAVIYAGTGDPNISSYVFLGQGLFKSEDYGETWEVIGLEDAGILSSMAIHPDHPDTLFVGSMGVPQRRGLERGLYRSVNGGADWEKVFTLSDEAGITDVLIHPDQPDLVFACGWHRVRNQAESIVNGSQARLYRSTDGGDTWEVIQDGLPDGPLSRSGLAFSQGKVFVMFVGANQQLRGIYSSADEGDTWSAVPVDEDENGLAGNALGGFGWYFGKIAVNPLDANDIFLLGVDLWRTQDGGETWSRSTPPWWVFDVHADKHDLRFHPDGFVDLATDGGCYTSQDGGTNWTDLDLFPATQFYRIGLNPHDPAQLIGGAQDNGTVAGWSDPADWTRIYGGDGFQPAFHPDFPEIIYAEWQGGGLVMSWDGGNSWDDFTEGIDPNDRVGWDAPYFVSVHPPHPLYHGTNRVYRNSDAFIAAWQPISPQLTDTLNQFHPGTHVITAMGESPVDPGVIYAGTGDGRLWQTLNDGLDWSNISTGLPARYVTKCQGSVEQSGRLFVSHSGYRYNEFISHFHRSDDQGATWQSLAGDLPPLGINTFAVIPQTGDSVIIVGTDAGVFATINGGENWYPFGIGLPGIPVYDMAYQPESQSLVIGTHARSMFTISLEELLEPVNTSVEPSQPKVSPWRIVTNPATDVIRLASGRSVPTGSVVDLELIDLSGRIHSRQVVTSHNGAVIEMSVSSIGTGMYYLRITESPGKSTILPVVITH
ncbi:MAG: hypothetical protein H6568_02580 [Lewinellaceae bacterium]|nr:hypothetical protein [Lewinellaceae bacterium]